MTEEQPGQPETVFGSADDVAAAVDRAVGEAFAHVTAEHQTARGDSLFALTMSGLGGCRRQAAYRLAATEPTDPDLVAGEHRTANLGTAVHRILLPALAHVLPGPAAAEAPVVLQDGSARGVPGTTDLWWEPARAVIDLKTVGEHKLDRVLTRGESPEHRKQVGGYALAKDARWVVWLYLDRSTGCHAVVVEEFGPAFRAEVWERVWEIQRLARDPDFAPRDEHGPGLSYVCDGCPWLRRCWGRDARTGVRGAQSHIAMTDPQVETALGMYCAHRDEESRHKKLKNFWREVATGGGRKPGPYGKWRFYFTGASSRLDEKRVRADYAEREATPPTREETGRLYVRPVK
ncbi:hypothetical protein [Streptomyces yaizuensis]|uniref:PD-(D/E)XK nuclease family protein n=1 Tax=Streptomyces yaizuensis TaxID=2989713 RepID=A0AA86JGG9_9ACTN|nr:hypothetical protein [Streptomyces sp. YSPA8]BDT39574.1 PD-(D/E)XK nuclease family protein [Streptomyces sp. YSPA8]